MIRALAALLLAAPASAGTYAIEYRLVPAMLEHASWTPAGEAAVKAHFRQLAALRDAGKLAFAGRTTGLERPGRDAPSSFGIAILSGVTEAEAQAVLEADAAVRAGVMTATLHPFAIALERAETSRGTK